VSDASVLGWRLIVRELGGPEVLEREDFAIPEPGPGEVVFQTEAVGLNFIDTYFRKGLYPAPLPIALGSESAGTVLAVGPDVDAICPGDRVGAYGGSGAYATHRLCNVQQLVKLPEDIDTRTAAAIMVKGFTACYLAEDIEPIEAGQWALVHSAAGGTGSLLTAWLRDKGVKVVAHVGSPEKAQLVEAEHVLTCPFADLSARVREVTGGEGVAIVYDGVGKDTFPGSLDCISPTGMWITFGNASGPVPPVAPLTLMQKGSLIMTRPMLNHYIRTTDELTRLSRELFQVVKSGAVKIEVNQTYALKDAAKAHRDLESRKTTGSTVLIP